ncbi:MAG: Unknown protein [uncultured Thiotrichaceae bacterium]|uniref:Uncharacterized protein n=1 Tax=uncultured Thiotrichaceae bacterium TaxID=298394 RepID=A0A6S6THR3_9GAMM|nr:MAG: Unknown protein [uncultured Thiotrichaceae bacterium]
MTQSLKHSINAQRALLNDLLSKKLSATTRKILPLLSEREQLDNHLRSFFQNLDHCKYIYVLNENGVQISSTINRYGADEEQIGRDRSKRPYMQHIDDCYTDFNLSEAYISRNKKRPSVTAIQTIHNESKDCVGYLGVDFDLRELPHSDVIYEEPRQWRQIKGDPAIRQGVFLQQRIDSLMDKNLDNVMSVHESLILDQGVHHIQMHFSSSRSTIWHVDDPYVYRLLTMEELSDTNICLAYPQRSYFKRAIIPAKNINKILSLFKTLRFADDTIYLRSASLNIVNGKVGLNFSCDGTHYLEHDEFLAKGIDFWFGGEAFPQAVITAKNEDIDHMHLDTIIEKLAGEGCMKVNKLLYAIEKGEIPEILTGNSATEREYIYNELKSVMDVYEGGVCSL